jgi:D-amino-acid oxidase
MIPMLNSHLVPGENLSFDPKPLVCPAKSSPRILVVGGGITGLATSWVLLDRGYHVTIIAKEWASYTKDQRLTSQIAGALWEYPPAVCGSHTDTVSLLRSKRWCMIAYGIWATIAADPALAAAAGVQMKKSAFFFPYSLEDNPKQLNKLYELARSGVRGLCRDPTLIQHHNVNPTYGAVDAYEHLAPIIDTDQCMTWLMNLVQSKGAKFVTETIYGDLYAQEELLLARFCASAIVNATGLACSSTASDSTAYPLRGALLRLINDGSDFPKVDTAMAIAADTAHDGEIVFIVPRNNNTLLLGGIAQRGEAKLDLTLDSPVIKRMRARCEKFLPSLKNARLHDEYPLSQGLRPCRTRNVRCEREASTRELRGQSKIVHSYGHGGAGWSLSFGCAEDVATLVEEAVREGQAEQIDSRGSGMLHGDLVFRSRL